MDKDPRGEKRRRSFLPAFILPPLLLAATLLPACAPPTNTAPKRIPLGQQEDARHWANIYLPVHLPAPALLLLHRKHLTPADWQSLGERFAHHGYLTLIPNLNLDHFDKENAQTSLNATLETIERAKIKSLETGADPENLYILGEGLGASLALIYAYATPAIQGALLFSPPLKDHNINIEGLFAQNQQLPILLMAAQHDTYACASANRLKSLAHAFCEYRNYPGSAHGFDLLTTSPDAWQQCLQWLDLMTHSAPQKNEPPPLSDPQFL